MTDRLYGDEYILKALANLEERVARLELRDEDLEEPVPDLGDDPSSYWDEKGYSRERSYGCKRNVFVEDWVSASLESPRDQFEERALLAVPRWFGVINVDDLDNGFYSETEKRVLLENWYDRWSFSIVSSGRPLFHPFIPYPNKVALGPEYTAISFGDDMEGMYDNLLDFVKEEVYRNAKGFRSLAAHEDGGITVSPRKRVR